MSEQNGGNGDNGIDFGKELGKFLRAGVGAVASAVEQGKGFVDDLTTEGTATNQKAGKLVQDLAKKGEETLAQTRTLGEQLKGKVKDAVCDGALDCDNILSVMDRFSKEELAAIRDKANELLGKAEGAAKGAQDSVENWKADVQDAAAKFEADLKDAMKDQNKPEA